MAHGAEQPSYVVISRPLSGKEGDPNRWLGRFVRMMNKPTDQYAPTIDHNLVPIIEPFFLDELSDTDATIFTQSVKDESLAVKLTDIFNLDRTSHGEKTTELKTPHIATFSLQQHQMTFDALMGNEGVRKQTLSLLRSPACKGRLFMIVGAKVVYDGSVSVITDLSQSLKLKTIVPAAEIAAAAAANPAPLLSASQNPEVEQSKEQTRKSDASHSFTGARIFAFEYKKVTLPKSLIFRKPQDPYFSPDSPGFDWSHQVFSGSHKPKTADQRREEEGSRDDSKVPASDQSQGTAGERSSKQPEEPRAQLADSSVQLADVGDLGIGWQTEAFTDANPGVLIYEAPDSESEGEEDDGDGDGV